MLITHPPQNLRATFIALPGGSAGIRKTTAIMARLVRQWKHDPNLNARAISIVQLAPPKDGPREVGALFYFVRDVIRYVNDVNGTETLRTPDKTLALKAGDCDDKTLLLGSMLESIGYQVKFAVAGYNEPDVYEHIYIKTLVPGYGWIALDPSEKVPPGWEAPDPVAYYEQEIPA